MPPTNTAELCEQLLLGRYRVLEVRGQGGFGTVYICWDPRLMRRVAIKSIALEPHDAPRGGKQRRQSPDEHANLLLRAALDETRTASMLAHPNIVQMIDFERDESFAYIIMEYVEGASLAELLDATDDGLLTLDEAAAVVEGVCDALQFAHDNGVLHLDIKPDNIMVDMSGRVKLADFGMATLSSATGYSGARGGTVGYMPPEQADGADVDVRTDVFAFACVMYEALTGLRPFAANSVAESRALVVGGAPDPCAVSDTVPVRVADALLDALEADPERRTGSAEAFAAQALPALGRPKAGKRSLASLVGDVLDDSRAPDPDMDDALAGHGAQGARGSDAGALGARAPRAARVLLRACGAVLPAAVVAMAAAALAPASDPALAATGFAVVALMGLAAPQLASFFAPLAAGGACVAAGFLPLGAATLAAGFAWWVCVGRLAPLRAAAAFASCVAPAALAPLTPQLSGYLLDAPRAAATAGVSALVAACLLAVSGDALAPTLALGALSWVGSAAIAGALSTGGGKLRCYLGCLASSAVLAWFQLVASCMENGGALPNLPAEALAPTMGSTILVILLIFALGPSAAIDESPEA